MAGTRRARGVRDLDQGSTLDSSRGRKNFMAGTES
jgi:hypothetical protein